LLSTNCAAGTNWADRINFLTLNARTVDATRRGSLACVSRESHTPNTSDVGAIWASGSALPFCTALNAFCKSALSAEQRTRASAARCPASNRFTCLSPARTTTCGISSAYPGFANSGSMRFACEPTLSTRHTFDPSANVSML
jgi:hypothetical protein